MWVHLIDKCVILPSEVLVFEPTREFADKIKAELLARSITKLENPEYTETVEIADEQITIKLKR